MANVGMQSYVLMSSTQLSARRAEFLGVFATIPGLEPSEQARAAAYLQGFFSDVDSGKIFKTCIN